MTKLTKCHVRAAKTQSAWASAQCDHSLRCSYEESLGPLLPIERTAKTDQTDVQAELSTVILLLLL